MNTIHLDKKLTARDVTSHFKISRQTLHAWIKKGYFPKPIKFGYVNRWSTEAVIAFENKQLSA